jgi:hypothetical protein
MLDVAEIVVDRNVLVDAMEKAVTDLRDMFVMDTIMAILSRFLD